ncbi:MAG: tRNA lysidine(34) synthetase TilS [Parcubacteria group bacterium]|nr:tRNA lysidine(34) synthetase TilS [Parcubacteria group bacterium]
MLQDQAQKTITEHKLITPGDKIIVGVSGGPDSVCLLYFLSELQAELDLNLVVAHVNYGLRGEESDRDEIFVKKLAGKYNLPCKILHPPADQKKSTNLEANLRDIRYKFFQDLRTKEKADKIAVAHNRDDQAETILMFFLRGSGLKGLSGMDYQQGKIIRPLLDCSRQDILAYLKANKLDYHEDKTNQDTKYTRNKIRHELIPYLEKEYNSNLRETLTQASRITRDEHQLINELVKKSLQSLAQKNKDAITMPLADFLKLKKALQRGILRHIFTQLLGDTKDISALDLEETLRMLKESRPSSHRDVKGLRIAKKDGKMVINKVINA